MQEMQKIILGKFLQAFFFFWHRVHFFPQFQLIPSLIESPLLVSTSSCEIEDKVEDRECCLIR